VSKRKADTEILNEVPWSDGLHGLRSETFRRLSKIGSTPALPALVMQKCSVSCLASIPSLIHHAPNLHSTAICAVRVDDGNMATSPF